MTRKLHIIIAIPDDDGWLVERHPDATDLAEQYLSAWGEYQPPEFTATWEES
jgi:hypothetical protein